ncbi:hypothetical protein [Acidithiobacillus thiooxidans]|uniref:Uncharacterized protein n=1 Tax=Acidithiobacillus thiooxidans TaxID=930 RepID=A0A1C2JGV4_ACITH|nr:hypothetical protein [Acidithiobacillus thiooxidans]OCX72448.1 hypothetical protein A6M23_09795 [Acidithiobacillus thiooxidans]OCX87426.1 hypothetical protein A6P08_02755 [Acidithiobacillus thiooxidans]
MNRVFQMVLALVVAGVAMTEQPRAVFNALHEMGEGREVAEQVRARVGFFALALIAARRAAFVLGSSALQTAKGRTSNAVRVMSSVHEAAVAAVNHTAAWLSGHHPKYLTGMERIA